MNRNEEYFYKYKVKNREKTSNRKLSSVELVKEANMGNDIEDDKKYIFRFVPELRKKMGYQ